MLWSAGRIALPNRPRQEGDSWDWHPMPLSEWEWDRVVSCELKVVSCAGALTGYGHHFRG